MQTSFTANQLEDPRIAEADRILRSCVHCGLCTATCPTYLLLGDERDSPRGRIYQIKDMLEGEKPASPEVTRHLDRCLSCLSCMTTCPSGVDYMHLVDLARTHIEETGRRPVVARFQRWLVHAIVPHPWRFRLALLLARLGRPLAPLLRRIGLKPVAAMLDLAPRRRPRLPWIRSLEPPLPPGKARKRVLMLTGCAQPVLRPEINEATVRLFTRFGIEVVAAPGAGCCGALVQHMGRERDARAQARRTIEAWIAAMGDKPLDAIVINASGCGTTIKDYGHMFAHDEAMWKKAAHVGGLAKDVTEVLATHDLGAPKRWSSIRVAYHSACSMQHGQRIASEPRNLLAKAGFAVVEVPEGHICCGSAGSYNMLQPDLSRQLRDRKIANIDRVRPDVIATGNIGCITQLQQATEIPIVHTVELLDWAYGGPCPRGLEAFESRVQEVPQSGIRTITAARPARGRVRA